jgi:hypothetical protein
MPYFQSAVTNKSVSNAQDTSRSQPHTPRLIQIKDWPEKVQVVCTFAEKL